MKELFRNFWSKQSYAIRFIRLTGNLVGVALASVELPLPGEWGVVAKAVGGALLIGSPLLTGTNATPSGIPPKPRNEVKK